MREITGGAVESISAVKALGTWLGTQGVDLRSVEQRGDDDERRRRRRTARTASGRKGQLTKAAVRAPLERPGLPAAAREALEVRQDYGRSSTAKIVALAGAVSPDRRLRGSLLYHGTLTGRQTGRLFQPQNLPRDFHSADDWPAVLADMRARPGRVPREARLADGGALVRLLRGAIVPADGCELAIGDFATVELRCPGLARRPERSARRPRPRREDLRADGARIYRVPIDSIAKDTTERKFGKVTTLGCGYGLGWRALIKQAANGYDLAVDEPLARDAIDAYRTGYPTVPLLWRELEDAAFDAIEAPGVPIPVCDGRAALKMTKNLQWLGLQLPSGRWVRLHQPKIILDDRNGHVRPPRATLSVDGD